MQKLKPITVGPLTIDAPVILAPMTGVTDLPFRKIVKRYGAGLTVSEMIASQAMRTISIGRDIELSVCSNSNQRICPTSVVTCTA